MKTKDKTLNLLIIISIVNAVCMLLGIKLNIIRYGLLILEFLVVLFCDEKRILPMILFLHPNSASYDDIGFTYLFNFSLVILMIKLFYYCKGKMDKNTTVLFLLIVCLEFILILKSGYIDKGLLSTVSWISSYLILILYSKNIEKIDFVRCYKYFFIGFTVAFLGGITYPIKRWGIANIPTAYRFTGLLRDPNYYCIDALILIFSTNTYAKLTNKNSLFYIIVTFILGICSVSKTFILLFAIGMLLKIITSVKKINPFKCVISVVIFLVAIMALYKLNYINLFIEKYLYRSETTSLFTGRDYLYKYYINALLENPFNVIIGNSLLKYPYMFSAGATNEFYTNFVAHNTYLDLILSWGIIGTTMYVAFICLIFNNAQKRYENLPKIKNKDFMITLIVGLLALFILSYLSVDIFAILILYLLVLKYVYCNQLKDNTEERKENG